MSEYQEVNVIPAKAGIQGPKATAVAPCSGQGQALDPRFREGDDTLLIMLLSFRAPRDSSMIGRSPMELFGSWIC
jgi:hypothetical protein